MSRARRAVEFEPYEPLLSGGMPAGRGRTHTTRSCYRAGCRDECCKRAERLYRRAYRRRGGT